MIKTLGMTQTDATFFKWFFIFCSVAVASMTVLLLGLLLG